MENKTYKDKLKNIIRQLPWLYDTESSAIVRAVNSLNHLELSKEINKFEELCNEEFSNVEIKDLCYDKDRGMVLRFDIRYNDRLFAQECLTNIINGVRNNTIVKEIVKETVMTDVDKMEKVLSLFIATEYHSDLEYLIGLRVLDNTIYNDILSINNPMSLNKVIDILEEGYVTINQYYDDIKYIVEDIIKHRNVELNPSDYVILDYNGDFVKTSSGAITIYKEYIDAYNDIDKQSDATIYSCVDLPKDKQEELINYIKSLI